MGEIPPLPPTAGAFHAQPPHIPPATQQFFQDAQQLQIDLQEYKSGDTQLALKIQQTAQDMDHNFQQMENTDPTAFNNPYTQLLEQNLSLPIDPDNKDSKLTSTQLSDVKDACDYLASSQGHATQSRMDTDFTNFINAYNSGNLWGSGQGGK
jgi:hypothetical protein